MKQLNAETENKLKSMYYQVENDMKDFPFLETTESFFHWREAVKEANGNDGALRNEAIERMINGNASLELLYDWSKFCRMVDRAKANVFLAKEEANIEQPEAYRIKAANMLHNHLMQNQKGNTEQLFGIFQIPELNLGIKHPLQRTINTPYEFEKAIVKEDENEPWPAVLFITLLRAYEISGEDLLTVGRKAEALGNAYVQEIKETYKPTKEKAKVLTK